MGLSKSADRADVKYDVDWPELPSDGPEQKSGDRERFKAVLDGWYDSLKVSVDQALAVVAKDVESLQDEIESLKSKVK